MIATDISALSLEKSKVLAKSQAMEGCFDFRCGDGLDVLNPNEADTIIISGIGGGLMTDILDRANESLLSDVKLVLVPHSKSALVRTWLCTHQFEIIDERMEKRKGKFYPAIYAKQGDTQMLTENQMDIGPILLDSESPIVQEYVSYLLKKTKRIVKSVKMKHEHVETFEIYKEREKRYEEALNWLKENE